MKNLKRLEYPVSIFLNESLKVVVGYQEQATKKFYVTSISDYEQDYRSNLYKLELVLLKREEAGDEGLKSFEQIETELLKLNG